MASATQEYSQQMINMIAADIENGILNVLGKEYSVVKIGKHSIALTGSRGAKYNLVSCPKAKVIQDKTMPVFSLVGKNGKAIDFGWLAGNAIELTSKL